ncbi:alpha/beta hydrolase [Jeotgalibacillus haloalkalitolerans]|uniref:Alpha/beta hydrolase n=1 Tax=Jeotgalibacillus haloalkalitolerans TaxID=3104292 RepID=A0ABU5KME6_9BACL|nr:alpha/beta hydrolase [Jeotgalibacillus sp. HH7-29]MDZ5711885.1 alpha/beta hydrolase [Jeotgalibacillus sp. HH7-29]
MHHIYHEGKEGKPVLLLLHGTGGTEQDLLPIADMIDPEASILSVRGNVSENGMPRFFKRLREGVFDIEDLKFRTKELNEFINDAAHKYQFDRSNVIAIGYSNGANIAGSLLFHYKDSLKAAILHHPMVPLRDHELPDLSGVNVFIGAGENDPICPAGETTDLTELLNHAGASVTTKWYNRGHQLIEEEVSDAKNWYQTL